MTADDLGMCAPVNEATLRAAREGLVRSVEIMAPAPCFREAAEALRSGPPIDVGVHLTLNSEFGPQRGPSGQETRAYRWGPLLPRTRVPSLCNSAGFFHADVAALSSVIDFEEASLELEAQVQAVLAQGLRPTHLTQHMLVLDELGARASARELLRALSIRHDLAVRVTNLDAAAWLADRGVLVVRRVSTGTYDVEPSSKLAAYGRLIRELPEGISEMVVHCAFDGDALRAITASAPRRQRDFELMVSGELQEVLDAEDVTLISWSDVRELLRRDGPP
jgi:predicted glycoside hydrolase/deacetylase ChbG (UPF0249 family)